MSRLLFWLTLGVVVVGCAQVQQAATPAESPSFLEGRCDLGFMRATKAMFCSDELRRRAG